MNLDGISSINKAQLSETVQLKLFELINDQNLSPGDTIPSEAELAKHFCVSRSVIREALMGLVSMGIVEKNQGKLATISHPSANNLYKFLKYAMFISDNGLGM